MRWSLISFVQAQYLQFSCRTSGSPTLFPLGDAVDQSALEYEGLTEDTAKAWLRGVMDSINNAYRENFNVEFKVVSLLFPSDDSWLKKGPKASKKNCNSKGIDTEKKLDEWTNYCKGNCPVKAVAWHLLVGCKQGAGAPGYAWPDGACGRATSLSLTWTWYIMAHEIGHLLGAKHSSNGIMAAGPAELKKWPQPDGPEQFTTQAGNDRNMCGQVKRVRDMLASGQQCRYGKQDVTADMPNLLGNTPATSSPGHPSTGTTSAAGGTEVSDGGAEGNEVEEDDKPRWHIPLVILLVGGICVLLASYFFWKSKRDNSLAPPPQEQLPLGRKPRARKGERRTEGRLQDRVPEPPHGARSRSRKRPA